MSRVDKFSVTLIGQNKYPFDVSSAPVHKLILAHALRSKHIIYRDGKTTLINNSDYLIEYNDGGIDHIPPDKIVVRHGANTPIEKVVSNEWHTRIKNIQQELADYLEISDHPADDIKRRYEKLIEKMRTNGEFVHTQLKNLSCKYMLEIHEIGIKYLIKDGVFVTHLLQDHYANYINDDGTLKEPKELYWNMPKMLFGIQVTYSHKLISYADLHCAI